MTILGIARTERRRPRHFDGSPESRLGVEFPGGLWGTGALAGSSAASAVLRLVCE